MKRQYVAFMLAIFLLNACKKEQFTTESEWLSPLLKTTLSMKNVVADSLLKNNSSNSLDLVYQYNYDLGDLDDLLVVPDKTDTLEAGLSGLV